VTNFDRCQLTFTVLQEHAELHFQRHVTYILQFKFEQLSKLNLTNDKHLNYILKSRDCF